MRKLSVCLFAALAALATTAMAAGGVTGAARGREAPSAPAPVPLAHLASGVAFPTPPTTAQCEAELGLACYAPFQYHAAYDLAPLYKKGFDGKGETIVIVDSFGYQYIRSELATFDKSFGLPAPPSFKIIHPVGAIPAYNPTKRPMMAGWALETSLDVEYAHTMAPGANILLVETPVPETLGAHGFPQIVKAENYVIDHKLGTVITQSFAAPENTFPSQRSILDLRSAFKNAAAHGVSVLAAAGDAGSTGPKTLTNQGFASSYFLHRLVNWPASDPLVTGLGGTQMHLASTGARTQPDTVWNDTNLENSPAAGGGGRSTVFGRPSYQNGVAHAVAASRGVPDISMSAAVDGAALVYLDKAADFGPAGFYLVGGTSEASPLFAGVVAIADQYAGHGLGLLNPALYKMEAAHAPGIVDVTAGTNTVTFPQGGTDHTVLGFDAVKGYDLASGVGTVDAALFVPELVAAAHSG